MFGTNGHSQNGSGTAIARAPIGPKVYTPRHAPEEPEGPAAPAAPYRVTVPAAAKEPAYDKSFFSKFPQNSWEAWSRRVEMEWLTVARGMDSIIYGTIGALAGVAISAAPGLFDDNYLFVVWNPIGAATGALLGLGFAWRHWRNIFRAHEGLR